MAHSRVSKQTFQQRPAAANSSAPLLSGDHERMIRALNCFFTLAISSSAVLVMHLGSLHGGTLSHHPPELAGRTDQQAPPPLVGRASIQVGKSGTFSGDIVRSRRKRMRVKAKGKPEAPGPRQAHHLDGPRRVFECGWPSIRMLDVLFPDMIKSVDKTLNPEDGAAVVPGPQDILVFSGWERTIRRGGCTKNFPGMILLVQGEHTGAGKAFTAYDRNKKPVLQYPATYSGLATLITCYEEDLYNRVLKPEKRIFTTGERYLIYMVSRCFEHRETAFLRLSEVGRSAAHYGGQCKGDKASNETLSSLGVHENIEHVPKDEVVPRNMPGRMGGWIMNYKLFQRYRFCLVMENRAKEGYITEKLINAFIGGCIPIYYGTRKVLDIFNEKALIYYDVDNPKPALDRIRYLESNASAYEAMLREPVLPPGDRERILEDYFSYDDALGGGKLKHAIRHMLQLENMVS